MVLLTKTDDKPEFTHYRDEGCQHAKSCLACPFPRCIEEGGVRRSLNQERDEKIRKLHDKGWKARELAILYNLNLRTVYRILAKSKDTAG